LGNLEETARIAKTTEDRGKGAFQSNDFGQFLAIPAILAILFWA
jgi:hypothetical protein